MIHVGINFAMKNKVVCSHRYITFIDVLVSSCWSPANICSFTSIANFMNDHVEIFMVWYFKIAAFPGYSRNNYKTKLCLCIEGTDKETDESWDIFIIWKINFGLWAVGWAGMWKKELGQSLATFEVRFLGFHG